MDVPSSTDPHPPIVIGVTYLPKLGVAVMPEDEIVLRGPVVMVGDNLPSPDGIGLNDHPLAPPVPASLGGEFSLMK